MAKKEKTIRLTAERKAFLDIVKKLGKYFDDDGILNADDFTVDDLAEEISAIFDKFPKRLRSIDAFSSLFGSAMYILQMVSDFRDVDSCSAPCIGGEPFAASFLAGWSIGYDDGLEDGEDSVEAGDAR